MWLQLIKVRFLLSTFVRLYILQIKYYYSLVCFYSFSLIFVWNWRIWINYLKEGLLCDQIFKLLLNNYILYWIILGAQFFNFTYLNRWLFTFYYNNIFLILYFNITELVQYSFTLILWKLGLIVYISLFFFNISYYLI